jgi:hypothetical protein
MLNEDLTDMHKVNRTPPEAENDDCQSPPTKTLTVKEIIEAADHLEQFLSTTEECGPDAERNLQGYTAIDRGTACYELLYREKRKASIQHSLDQFFKEAGMYFSALRSATYCWLNSCMDVV